MRKKERKIKRERDKTGIYMAPTTVIGKYTNTNTNTKKGLESVE